MHNYEGCMGVWCVPLFKMLQYSEAFCTSQHARCITSSSSFSNSLYLQTIMHDVIVNLRCYFHFWNVRSLTTAESASTDVIDFELNIAQQRKMTSVPVHSNQTRSYHAQPFTTHRLWRSVFLACNLLKHTLHR